MIDKRMGQECDNGLGGSSPSHARLRLEPLLRFISPPCGLTRYDEGLCVLLYSGAGSTGVASPTLPTGGIPPGATSSPPSTLLLTPSPSMPSLATLSVFNRAESLEATASLPWVRPLSWDSRDRGHRGLTRDLTV